jgi:membrane dipeptidase
MSCDAQYKDIVRACLDQVDVIRRMIDKYSWAFKLVTTADGIMEAFNEGKIGSMIGVEGGHCIDSSIATLRMFYNLGARYMTITHNCDTPWADTNSQDESGPVGLSDFGVTVIDEMNRLGMIVDLSHVSAATMREVLQVSRAPVIFSHSSAYGLCPSNRNVPDDVLQLIKEKNGLVMVNFYPNFVTCSNNATTSDVADHIDYIRNLIGPEYVGIGADYDGINRVPVGLEDTSKYPNLFQELQIVATRTLNSR